jgi:phenylacetate-coenzyme A ligase PaaK-like adenylate-forming protein
MMDWESSSSQLRKKIRAIQSENFEALTLDVFRHQVRHNPLYRQYTQLLHIEPEKVQKLSQIPFLPIQFFKSYQLKSGDWEPAMQFSSSGTGQSDTTSQHAVWSTDWYLDDGIYF